MKYLPLILLFGLLSCTNDETENDSHMRALDADVIQEAAQDAVSAQEGPGGIQETTSGGKITNLSGHYDKEQDAWVTTVKSYTTHTCCDGTTIQFDGEKYASFSRMQNYKSTGMGLMNKKGEVIVQPMYSSMVTSF